MHFLFALIVFVQVFVMVQVLWVAQVEVAVWEWTPLQVASQLVELVMLIQRQAAQHLLQCSKTGVVFAQQHCLRLLLLLLLPVSGQRNLRQLPAMPLQQQA